MSKPIPDAGGALTVYVTPYEVDARLKQLGVSRRPLVLAALQGDLQRRLCTPDDFYATPGYVGWARTLRTLREELRRDHGWHRGDFRRIPVCFNSEENVAIAAAGGNQWTGVDGQEQPATREKGQGTVDAVEMSGTQRVLEFEAVDFWYLLTYATDGELRVELSCPTNVNDARQINRWSERILIGLIDPNTPMSKTLDVPVAPEPEIAVDVRRKLA